MASASVNIDSTAIIAELNTPGGAVFVWRDEAAQAIVEKAEATSPVNKKGNATHRGGLTGTYKRGWQWDGRGSNGNTVRATIWNTAPHAPIVEFGRGPANFTRQTFAWTKWRGIRTTYFTRARRGKHILQKAVNAVGSATGDWSPL